MPERVLCVVAHPDDETLLCGATLAKHVLCGDEVRVLAVADGETARATGDKERRRAQFLKACMVLKAYGECLSLPDQRLECIPQLEINRMVEERVSEFRPSIVYTHSSKDENSDHRRVAECVAIACRPQSGVLRILAGEVLPSPQGFAPNWYVDICATLKRKLRAMQCYPEELRRFPHARSLLGVEYLAKVRGQTVGLESVEAFELVRSVT